jgi:hypothetical protein
VGKVLPQDRSKRQLAANLPKPTPLDSRRKRKIKEGILYFMVTELSSHPKNTGIKKGGLLPDHLFFFK